MVKIKLHTARIPTMMQINETIVIVCTSYTSFFPTRVYIGNAL